MPVWVVKLLGAMEMQSREISSSNVLCTIRE